MDQSQHKTPIFDALKAYRAEGVIAFDVPGHKQGKGNPALSALLGEEVLAIDANSMKSLDNLANPISVIKEAESLLADTFGADYAYFLVNGTSSGVQSMIMSVMHPHEKILIPRNIHKSAITGILFSGAIPVYMEPIYDKELGIYLGLSFEEVKQSIDEHDDAKALFLINPTYYGAANDLERIVAYAHERGLTVLVDEAHGAHLCFHDELPMSAMQAGADISAVSLHKTGGSLTQSSALLLKGNRVDPHYLRKIINMTQTTSASYLLMGSLDVARKQLALEGEANLAGVLALSRQLRERINKIPGIKAIGKEVEEEGRVFRYDETKIVVHIESLSINGFELYDILREDYHVQMELGDAKNVLAIISLGDNQYAVDRFVSALEDISRRFYVPEDIDRPIIPSFNDYRVVYSPRDAFYLPKETLLLSESVGRICGESIMAYPPGVPIVNPGELITEEMIDYIRFLLKQQTVINGPEDSTLETIKVLKV